MAAKTIMKRIAIAALSAVILQGVTPLDSLNVYASENTGASYTVLDLYTYIQDQRSSGSAERTGRMKPKSRINRRAGPTTHARHKKK